MRSRHGNSFLFQLWTTEVLNFKDECSSKVLFVTVLLLWPTHPLWWSWWLWGLLGVVVVVVVVVCVWCCVCACWGGGGVVHTPH